MKKLFYILSLGFFTIFTSFMVISIVSTHAAEQGSPLNKDLCSQKYEDESGNTIKNIYNDKEIPLQALMEKYHENTNKKFNEYIKKMIAGQGVVAKSGINDPNSIPPEDENECFENLNNYSTFCVARNLLSNTKEGDGYLQYAQALNCRKNDAFDTATEKGAYNDWLSMNTCPVGVKYGVIPCSKEDKAELEKKIQDIYQGQKALTISARLEAITRETDAAKRALDQTLSAYDELKTAWPMHKQYIQIYKELVKYRDKLVEIRHQVEEFPSKFIDATTIKCT